MENDILTDFTDCKYFFNYFFNTFACELPAVMQIFAGMIQVI